MASIQEKTPGSFTVYIRKKYQILTETFKTREDAELWACYKAVGSDKKLKGNAINIFKSKFYTLSITEYQKFWLDLYEIEYHKSINFLEAAFLLWKRNLKEKYGQHTRKNTW